MSADGGNVGNITGSTAGDNGSIEADGIAYDCLTVGGNIEDVNGQAEAGYGILSTGVIAGEHRGRKSLIKTLARLF